MNQGFEQSLKHWFQKSYLALEHRPSKQEELKKRLHLSEYAEYNADYSINMVNICGVYEVVGGNPDMSDSFYTGLLTIDLVSNQIEATWLIEGEQHQTGYGFVFNNTLVIHFSYFHEQELFNGIVAYHFLTPDSVIGKWTEEIAIENAFEMGRRLTYEELGEEYPEDYFSVN